MRAPFPSWSNHALRLALWLLVLLIVGTPTFLWALVRTPSDSDEDAPRTQPVFFDHRHHVKDDGIDCYYCHELAERSRYAGVPAADRCMGCHAQVWNQSPLLELVRESFFEDRPIVWRRVWSLPDYVFFDHSAHVLRGVGCETCHGRVDEMPAVYQVRALTMGWCLGCHRDPEPQLRPLDAITTMGWSSEKSAPGRRPPKVQPPTSCSGCHR